MNGLGKTILIIIRISLGLRPDGELFTSLLNRNWIQTEDPDDPETNNK